MAQKPLMLKDYIELDSCSESFEWAALQRGGNTVRRLLETELGASADVSGWRLVRFRSKGELTRFSAVISILRFSTNDSPAIARNGGGGGQAPLLLRSFSKKLRRSFWKKRSHEKEEGEVMVKDIVRLRSFDEEAVERGSLLPSPVLSRYSSSSDLLSSTASFNLFVDGKQESMPRSPKDMLSPSPENGIFDGVGDESHRPSTGSREPKEICGKDMDCPSEEEKEQLSPVSVMDFPYQEDEDEEVEQPSAISPCFEQSITNIERTKNQLLLKIRRFECLASLDPVDLDQRFACTEAHRKSAVHVETDEEEAGYENEELWRQRTACALLCQLTGRETLQACGEKLLFDFFVECLSFSQDCRRGTKIGSAGDEELLRAGSSWVSGGGSVAEDDCEAVVRELERCGGGWRRSEEEEEVVAVEMTGRLVTWLLEELVDDLLLVA